MPLIQQIHNGTESGDLSQPFKAQDLKEWIKKHNIVKDDGEPYAESSVNAILSNSDTKNSPTSNKNTKVLKSRINNGGDREYFC